MTADARRLNLAPTYSGADVAVVSLIAVVVAVWAAAAGGTFSLRALIACQAALAAFYLVGGLLAAWQPLASGALFELPLRLLAGYAAVNTALLVLAWVSPLGIVANFGLLLALAVAMWAASKPVRRVGREGGVGFLVVILSLAAATLWCQDALRPTSLEGNTVVFKPWIDGFYHAVHVRIFGAGHGASTIEDFRMAGIPARLYHYGCYLTPALIQQASGIGIGSYAAFAGILAPLGVFFTGLAAYALVGSLWGRWAGLAASAALLLLPDGAQAGMQNTFMSYHWLTQISPSASYGLVLLALAWLFVLLGCNQGRLLQVVAGWLIAGVLAFYKLHFFIASALPLVLLPPLFFRGALAVRTRVAWGLAAVAVYVVALVVVQKIPGVPPIRFDGSSVDKVLSMVKQFVHPGGQRQFLDGHLGAEHSTLSNLGFGVPYVLLSALGLFAPLLVAFTLRLRGRTPPLLVLFPWLLIANFLAMFFGLALDLKSSTPDELSHRPIIIVYFVVVTWIGGAAGLLLSEWRRWGGVARPARLGLVAGVLVSLLAVPWVLGSGVQRLWAMRLFSPVRVPVGLVRAAEYIREHGGAQDVFQDSQFDRTYVVAALSERRTYAARTMTIMTFNGEKLQQRIATVESLMESRDASAVAAIAREIGIRWFLLNPGDQVRWPDELANRPAFELDGYRLYQF